jgi:hypothetical protein
MSGETKEPSLRMGMAPKHIKVKSHLRFIWGAVELKIKIRKIVNGVDLILRLLASDN